jgi:hypothetical protein
MSLVGSQAGHLVTYYLNYGPAAWDRQSHGAHAYFPAMATATAGILSLGLLFSVLMLGVARLLRGRRLRLRATRDLHLFDLIAIFFTVQLAIYMSQETLESLASGQPLVSVVELLFWGAIGQLPVAASAALAFGWLSVRLEAAVQELKQALGRIGYHPRLRPIALPVPARPVVAMALSACAPMAFVKRGPPPLL